MRVRLQELQPNPIRDFTIDPIDKAKVEELAKSIKEDGFWGGVVCCRKPDGVICVVAGHHRTGAAIEAGVQEADLYVADMDEAQMIRIYARENATQRGNTSTALAGSVAAAVRFLVKGLMAGNVSGFPETSSRAVETLRGQIASDKGLGEPIITEFLDGVPGVNKNTVIQQLANLKSSGDYARIIREVQQEIEKEVRQAREALELAEREQREAEAEEERKKCEALKKAQAAAQKAADKATEREITFDFAGVSKHFKNPSHIDVFRELATGETARDYLKVEQQAALAKELVALTKIDPATGEERKKPLELSGRFIRENFMSLLADVKRAQKKLTAQEEAEIQERDWSEKARGYQEDMARNARCFLASAKSLQDHSKERPKGVTLHVTSQFKTAVENLKKAIALLEPYL